MRKKKIYSLYKGDVELAFGTAEEIAKKMGISKKTVYYYRTPVHKKRTKRKDKIKILIET